MDNLGLIQIADGVYARVNRVLVYVDVVDADGNMLSANGIVQSPDSLIELTGADLAGLDLPVQSVADKIYNLTQTGV